MHNFIRLLNVHTLKHAEFYGDAPSYICLSHCWQRDGETTYQSFRDGIEKDSPGHRKVLSFAKYVADLEIVDWIWIDTCCIDKHDEFELSKTINRMFNIYNAAEMVIVWLQDIEYPRHDSFTKARWFKRTWTLPEFLAARVALFIDPALRTIGHKAAERQEPYGPLLNRSLAHALDIPEECLEKYDPAAISDIEKWQWTKKRQTLIPEDRIYSLLGIFGVSMSLSYGEGFAKAKQRLLKQLRPTQRSLPAGMPVFPPRVQNDHLIQREALLSRLLHMTQPSNVRIALVGLGGIGKTQLAYQYAQKVFASQPNTQVLHLAAETAESFDRSVVEVVHHLLPNSRENDDDDVFEALRNWLLRDSSTRWIILVDNLEDKNLLFKPVPGRQKPRIDCIPAIANCRIIITSRNRNAVRGLVHMNDVINVPPMTEQEALSLLATSVGSVAKSSAGARIVKQLGYIPLAVATAGAYLHTMEPTMADLEEYSSLTLARDSSRLQELRRSEPQPDYHTSSIMAIWERTFEDIQAERPSAITTLSVISLLDSNDIPSYLLDELPLDSESALSAEVRDDLSLLLAWSLIRALPDHSGWSVHRLIHDIVRDRQPSEHHWSELEQIVVRRLHAHLSAAKQAKQSDKVARLVPHALSTTTFSLTDTESAGSWVWLLEQAATACLGSGRLDSALQAAKKAYEVRKAIFEPLHKETIDSAILLSQVYRAKGDWSTAMSIQEDSLAQTGQLVSPETAETTLKALQELASTYANSQAWIQAEWTLQKALRLCLADSESEKVKGDRLAINTQLASVYMGAGKWKLAEALHRDVLYQKETIKPRDEADVLLSKGDLAVALKKSGQLPEAEVHERDVLVGRRRLLGAKHRYTLVAMTNLATTLRLQQKYHESKDLGIQAMSIAKETYGETDPMTLTSMNDLAITYSRLQMWDKAQELQTEVLASSELVFGRDQLRTITAKANLAVSYRNTSRYNDAAQLEETVLQARRQLLGNEHPDTMRAVYNLAMTNWKRGQVGIAGEMMRSVVEMRVRIYGSDHAESKEAIDALKEIESITSKPGLEPVNVVHAYANPDKKLRRWTTYGGVLFFMINTLICCYWLWTIVLDYGHDYHIDWSRWKLKDIARISRSVR